MDDDRAIGATVEAILADAGYDVSYLPATTDGALRHAIDDLQPDCILLDSASATDYSPSWDIAEWIHNRARSVPVVMFSAHVIDNREARANLTHRSQAARFAAVLLKPFSIDELLDAVATAMDRSSPSDRSTDALNAPSEAPARS